MTNQWKYCFRMHLVLAIRFSRLYDNKILHPRSNLRLLILHFLTKLERSSNESATVTRRFPIVANRLFTLVSLVSELHSEVRGWTLAELYEVIILLAPYWTHHIGRAILDVPYWTSCERRWRIARKCQRTLANGRDATAEQTFGKRWA